MTRCWAIIPAKPLASAKTRLAPALGSREREALCLGMLEKVIQAVRGVPGLDWLVVSREPQALALARKWGGVALADRWEGLNPSLEGAIRWCAERGASAVLVLPSDIPLVAGEDIQALLRLGEEANMVASPCRRGEGTNALLLRPPGLMPLAFGPGSFRAHVKEAQERGLPLRVHCSLRLALDIDTLEDLEELMALVPEAARL